MASETRADEIDGATARLEESPGEDGGFSAAERTDHRRPRLSKAGTVAVWVNVVVVVIYRGAFGRISGVPIVEDWITVFVSVVLQAIPFLVVGVALSAAISALVPPSWFERLIPRRTALAVPAAGLAGAALPGCECSAVPVAKRLMGKGVAPAAALTFLLAAPALNPVVMVSTAAAFPGQPSMVFARFLASFLAAVVIGYLWSRFGRHSGIEARLRAAPTGHRHGFVEVAVEDFLQAGGFLVLGASLVASIQTLLPGEVVNSVGGSGLVAILTMALLAVLLSVCSEADAFVAAGLPQFSLSSRLVFLVVGPMIDVKLATMQAGTFGRRFAIRFAPLTFVVATAVAAVIGMWLL